MAVQLAEDELRGYLELVLEAPDMESRARRGNDLISHLTSTETLETWARSFAKLYGRPAEHEEFAQVIAEKLIVYIRNIDQETLDSIDRVATHLFYKSKTAVQTWLDSPAITVAQQMSGHSRRYRQAMAARGEYMSRFNKEPTDRELVDYINAKVTATRVNAVKQGALVTVDDVTGKMLTPYSMDHTIGDGEYAADSFGTPTPDDDIQHRAELSVTVRALGQYADEMFGTQQEPTAREVLAVWMEHVLDNKTPTVTAMAERFGLNRQKARERMNQVEAVLARMRETAI